MRRQEDMEGLFDEIQSAAWTFCQFILSWRAEWKWISKCAMRHESRPFAFVEGVNAAFFDAFGILGAIFTIGNTVLQMFGGSIARVQWSHANALSGAADARRIFTNAQRNIPRVKKGIPRLICPFVNEFKNGCFYLLCSG